MTIYSTRMCQTMIRHYEEQAVNWTKPARWREMALISITEWKLRLERAQA